MNIDSHLHVWRRDRGDYRWLSPSSGALWKDVGPADHESWLRACAIDGVILVQAADTVAETRFLLEVAASWNRVVGVVGWIPMDDVKAPAILDELTRDPLLVGVRPMLQDLDDDAWCLRPELAAAMKAMAKHSVTLDLLIKPRHLEAITAFRTLYPDVKMVLDHGGKPFIPAQTSWGDFTRWSLAIRSLAASPLTWCKFSGLMTEADPLATSADYEPYVHVLLDAFGPDRLLWGSDAPVCEVAGGPRRWHDLSRILLHSLSETEARRVGGLNATVAYNLSSARMLSLPTNAS